MFSCASFRFLCFFLVCWSFVWFITVFWFSSVFLSFHQAPSPTYNGVSAARTQNIRTISSPPSIIIVFLNTQTCLHHDQQFLIVLNCESAKYSSQWSTHTRKNHQPKTKLIMLLRHQFLPGFLLSSRFYHFHLMIQEGRRLSSRNTTHRHLINPSKFNRCRVICRFIWFCVVRFTINVL